MSKETLRVMARLSDIDVEIKEMDTITDWLLITYDLPHNEEGDKARREFLDDAKMVGAVRHTDSVYLMPMTPAAEAISLRLAEVKKGQVVVWVSKTAVTSLAKNITESYDKQLEAVMDDLSERMDRIFEHLKEGHDKLAENMIENTRDKMTALEGAVARRGSKALGIYMELLKRRFANL